MILRIFTHVNERTHPFWRLDLLHLSKRYVANVAASTPGINFIPENYSAISRYTVSAIQY